MKKAVALLMAAVMVFALCACGAKSDQNNAIEMTQETTPAPTSTPTPTPEPTEAPFPMLERQDPVAVSPNASNTQVGSFTEGLAYFKDASGKYGYIDTSGNVVIEAKYSYAMNFIDGRAVVSFSENNAQHDMIIDKEGNTIIGNMDNGSQYVDYSDYAGKGFPAVEIFKPTIKGGKVTHIDHQGFNYLTDAGTLLTNDKYMYVGAFSEGRALVGTGTLPKLVVLNSYSGPYSGHYVQYMDGNKSAAKNFYYIDAEGRRIGKDTWNQGSEYSEGLAAVAKLNIKGELIWGYIDLDGNTVLEPQFASVGKFINGIAAVKKDGKAFYIDKKGDNVFGKEFGTAYSFDNGYASVELNSKWGVIDKNGKEVLPCEYDSVSVEAEQGIFIIGKTNIDDAMYYGFSTLNGEVIVQPTYRAIRVISGDTNCLIFSNGEHTGLMDTTGKELFTIEDGLNLGIYGNSDYLLQVTNEQKAIGYIDRYGNTVRECEFEKASNFQNGIAVVWKEGSWFLMDEKGVIVF